MDAKNYNLECKGKILRFVVRVGPIGYGLLLYNHMRTFVLDACQHSHVQ